MRPAGRFPQLPRRPRLLVEALRIGLPRYDRGKMLEKILGWPADVEGGFYLEELRRLESAQNEMRLEHPAAYSAKRHVDLLVALVAEDAAVRRHRDSETSLPRRPQLALVSSA